MTLRLAPWHPRASSGAVWSGHRAVAFWWRLGPLLWVSRSDRPKPPGRLCLAQGGAVRWAGRKVRGPGTQSTGAHPEFPHDPARPETQQEGI